MSDNHLKNILLFLVVFGLIWFIFFRNDASCDFIAGTPEKSKKEAKSSAAKGKSFSSKDHDADSDEDAGLPDDLYGDYLRTFNRLKRKGTSVTAGEVAKLVSSAPGDDARIKKITAGYFYVVSLQNGDKNLRKTALGYLTKDDVLSIMNCVTKVKCSHCTGGVCRSCNGDGGRISDGYAKNVSGRGMHFTQYAESCRACSGTGKCRYCEDGFIRPVPPDQRRSAIIDKELCASEASKIAVTLKKCVLALSGK